MPVVDDSYFKRGNMHVVGSWPASEVTVHISGCGGFDNAGSLATSKSEAMDAAETVSMNPTCPACGQGGLGSTLRGVPIGPDTNRATCTVCGRSGRAWQCYPPKTEKGNENELHLRSG